MKKSLVIMGLSLTLFSVANAKEIDPACQALKLTSKDLIGIMDAMIPEAQKIEPTVQDIYITNSKKWLTLKSSETSPKLITCIYGSKASDDVLRIDIPVVSQDTDN